MRKLHPINREAAMAVRRFPNPRPSLPVPKGHIPCIGCTHTFASEKLRQEHIQRDHPSLATHPPFHFSTGDERTIGFDLIDVSGVNVTEEEKSWLYSETNDRDILDMCPCCKLYHEQNSENAYFLYIASSQHQLVKELGYAVIKTLKGIRG